MLEPLRYATVFGVPGALLGAACARAACAAAGPLAWSCVAAGSYVAVSLLVVSASYALGHLGVPVDVAYRHPATAPLFDALLLPYRVGFDLAVRCLERVDPTDLMHPVAARLYVGRLPRRADRRRLAEAGVSAVMNLCVEAPRGRPRRGRAGRRSGRGVESVHFPVFDGAAPSPGQLRAALDWIAERHAEGRSVLVHCAQGRGRSATVAAAALCRLGLADGPEESLARVASARPRVRPTRGQRAVLAGHSLQGRRDAPV